MVDFVLTLFNVVSDKVQSSGTLGSIGTEPEFAFMIISFLIFLIWNIFLTIRCWFLKLDIKDNKSKIDELEKKIDDLKKE